MKKEKEMSQLVKQRLMTVGIIIVFIFLSVSFLRVFLKDYELRKQINSLQGDVSKLQKRKIESLEVLKKLQSDSYIEGRAREELQAARPGEAVLVVPGLNVTSTATSILTVAEDAAPELSNPAKWWYYFFGSN